MNGTISEFFASANGDKWFLERDRNAIEPTVIHRANPASGGAETRWSVDDFLKVACDHPQGDALRNVLAEPSGLEDGGDAQPAAESNKAPTRIPLDPVTQPANALVTRRWRGRRCEIE